MKQFLVKSAKATFLALLFVGVVASAQLAGPYDTPPNANAPLPINVSSSDQLKQGGIGFSKLLIGPGSLSTIEPTSASILGNLRIGGGTPPSPISAPTIGSGVLQVNNKVGIGSTINIAQVPSDGLSVLGIIANGGGVFSSKNLYAGSAAFITPPAGAGTTGAVVADRFCFSGTSGTCLSGSWATGSTLLGATNNTVRFSAPNTPVAATNLTNDGSAVTIGNTLILNAGLTASSNFRVTAANKNFVEFWTNMSNTHAGIIANSINLKALTGVSSPSPLCVSPGGNVTTCGSSSGGGATVNVGSGVYRVPRYDIGGLSLSGSANLTNNDVTVKIGETQPATATRLEVSGGAIQINNAPLRVSLSGSGSAGTDAISLNTSSSSVSSSIITNRPGFNFWSSEGTGHNADIYVRDVHVGGDILIPGNIWSGGSITGPVISGVQLKSPGIAAGAAGYKTICANNIGDLVWCPPGNPTSGVQSYTTGGTYTWTVPAGVTTARIQVWGGGGGGSGGYASGNGGGGGGGAGYIDATIAVSGGQSYTAVVGGGGQGGMFGSPGNAGANGGNSVFNSTFIATGGRGAPTPTSGNSNGGLGGVPSASTGIAWPGFSGGSGSGSSPTGGAGGASGGGIVYGKGGDGGTGGGSFTPGIGGRSGAVIITYN